MARLSKAQRETKAREGTKTDCFGYNKEKGDCKVMTELLCARKKCSFYKPRERSDTNE